MVEHLLEALEHLLLALAHAVGAVFARAALEAHELRQMCREFAHGGDFADYVEARSKKTQDLPRHLVKVREGNEERVHYFVTDEDLAAFDKENPDLRLFGAREGDTDLIERQKVAVTRRATHVEIHESKAVADLLNKLARKGLNVEHYAAQDQPLFELTEGEGEKAVVKPLFSIPEILAAVKEVGLKVPLVVRLVGTNAELGRKILSESGLPITPATTLDEAADAIVAAVQG